MTANEARMYSEEVDRASLRGRIHEGRATLHLMESAGVDKQSRAYLLVEARVRINEGVHRDLYYVDCS